MLGIGLLWPFLAMLLLRIEQVHSRTLRSHVGGKPLDVELTCQSWGFLTGFGLAIPNLTLKGWSGELLWGRHVIQITGLPTRRGEVPLHQARFSTGYPFGLVEVTREWSGRHLKTSASLAIIWPASAQVDWSLLGGANAQAHRAREWAMSRAGGESGDGEFAGVRAYRRGDTLRSIHWRQTARHGRLIVREPGGTARHWLHVRLDTRRASYPNDDTFEQAVSWVAGACNEAARRQEHLALHLGPDRFEVSDDADLPRVMDALAGVQLDESRPEWSGPGEILVTGAGATGGPFKLLEVDEQGRVKAW